MTLTERAKELARDLCLGEGLVRPEAMPDVERALLQFGAEVAEHCEAHRGRWLLAAELRKAAEGHPAPTVAGVGE